MQFFDFFAFCPSSIPSDVENVGYCMNWEWWWGHMAHSEFLYLPLVDIQSFQYMNDWMLRSGRPSLFFVVWIIRIILVYSIYGVWWRREWEFLSFHLSGSVLFCNFIIIIFVNTSHSVDRSNSRFHAFCCLRLRFKYNEARRQMAEVLGISIGIRDRMRIQIIYIVADHRVIIGFSVCSRLILRACWE